MSFFRVVQNLVRAVEAHPLMSKWKITYHLHRTSRCVFVFIGENIRLCCLLIYRIIKNIPFANLCVLASMASSKLRRKETILQSNLPKSTIVCRLSNYNLNFLYASIFLKHSVYTISFAIVYFLHYKCLIMRNILSFI